MKPGDRVRMTAAVKEGLRRNGSARHVHEFGKCSGVIIDQFEQGTPIAWNVRWQPSNLRYAYLEEYLELAR